MQIFYHVTDYGWDLLKILSITATIRIKYFYISAGFSSLSARKSVNRIE